MRPDWIKPGTRVLNQWRLGPALTGEEPLDPPIKSLFVYNSNPAIVVPEQEKIIHGLKREDIFTVVSEQFLTDTARYADIVLPATTQLEQFDLMFSWGHLYLSLNQQAIAPLGELVSNTELFRRLARTMGFDDRQWQRSDEEMAVDALDWANPALQGITMDLLKEKGWARLNVGTPETYAPHANGNFLTPSGKCEFKASMAAGGTSCYRSSVKARTNSRRASRSIRCQPTFYLTSCRQPTHGSPPNIRSTSSPRKATHSSIRPMATCRVNCITPGSSSCLSIRRMPSHGMLAKGAPFGSSMIAAASRRSRR